MLIGLECDLERHEAEGVGVDVLGEEEARLAGEHVEVAEGLQVELVVVGVDGPVGVEGGEHEGDAERVRAQRVAAAAHEEEREGGGDRHLGAVEDVGVVGAEARAQVAAEAQHGQVARARHHQRQREHARAQAVLAAQARVIQLGEVFGPE